MVYEIDPLTDARWRRFIDRHPRASVFHTPQWLECLRRTYDYEPVAFASTPADQELQDGLLFCRVESWLTGRRLVSVPFSDHCDHLVQDEAVLPALLKEVEEQNTNHRAKYIELRPLTPHSDGLLASAGFQISGRFYHHMMDLRPGPDTLYIHFHKDCIQRKIRRAEREGLEYRDGRSQELLKDFYFMMLRTRRRHRLVPQPFAWFRNMADCLGDSMQVRAAYHESRPVAAIITLTEKSRMVYKYGCSDERFSALGGTQMLFWRAIREACSSGLLEFDLGRTECDNAGLVAFKERWGATRRELAYWRRPPTRALVQGWNCWRILSTALAFAPLRALQLAGTILYRHAG